MNEKSINKLSSKAKLSIDDIKGIARYTKYYIHAINTIIKYKNKYGIRKTIKAIERIFEIDEVDLLDDLNQEILDTGEENEYDYTDGFLVHDNDENI